LRRPQDLPGWAQKVLVAVAVVAFYFGARALNRWRVSFAARDVAIEALIPLMGVQNAREQVDRQHAACFDKAYKTGWGKWQDYSFDEKNHADCVLRRVMADVGRKNMARARAVQAAQRPPSVPGATMRPPPVRPVAPPTPRPAPPILGRVGIGNVQVLNFSRTPQLTGHLSFVAIGNADVLASVAMCSYVVTCEGQAQALPGGPRTIAPCLLTVQGAKGEGELQFAVLGPAPVEGACSLDLALTDGTQLRSNSLVVPLP
jgi:hypothetical protein